MRAAPADADINSSCAICGSAVELIVHETSEGPIVSAVCHACAHIRVPVTGPDAEHAVQRWRRRRRAQRRAAPDARCTT